MPYSPDETEKRLKGILCLFNKVLTYLSTPLAQPTETDASAGIKDTAKETSFSGTVLREPENPIHDEVTKQGAKMLEFIESPRSKLILFLSEQSFFSWSRTI